MGGLPGGEALSKEKKEALSNKRDKKMTIWWQETKLDSYIFYKVNAKWIEELNIENKTSTLILKTWINIFLDLGKVRKTSKTTKPLAMKEKMAELDNIKLKPS